MRNLSSWTKRWLTSDWVRSLLRSNLPQLVASPVLSCSDGWLSSQMFSSLPLFHRKNLQVCSREADKGGELHQDPSARPTTLTSLISWFPERTEPGALHPVLLQLLRVSQTQAQQTGTDHPQPVHRELQEGEVRGRVLSDVGDCSATLPTATRGRPDGPQFNPSPLTCSSSATSSTTTPAGPTVPHGNATGARNRSVSTACTTT